LRDISYGGGGEFVYLCTSAILRVPQRVYPAGGKGRRDGVSEIPWRCQGRVHAANQAASTPAEKFGAYAEQNSTLAPSPNWMRVSTFPNVLETADNNDREHATVAENLLRHWR
jgi:hypothetical protein